MPHELHHERRPDHTGELSLGAAPDGALWFDDGVATVADEARAEAIATRYVAVVYAGAADGDSDDTDADEAIATGDAEAFVDRTPVSDVAEDIRSGTVDEVLDEIEAAEEEIRDRETVYEAIDDRRSELEA